MPINIYPIMDPTNLFQSADGKKFYVIPTEYRKLEPCYNCGEEKLLYFEDENENAYCNDCVRIR